MIIGCISIIPVGGRLVGVHCTKNRGIIFPGGKHEAGETFKDTARRELLEEAGLVATSQKLIFHGAVEDGSYCYSFLTQIKEYEPVNSFEGEVSLYHWEDFLKSDFKAYYELLRERLTYEDFGVWPS